MLIEYIFGRNFVSRKFYDTVTTIVEFRVFLLFTFSFFPPLSSLFFCPPFPFFSPLLSLLHFFNLLSLYLPSPFSYSLHPPILLLSLHSPPFSLLHSLSFFSLSILSNIKLVVFQNYFIAFLMV